VADFNRTVHVNWASDRTVQGTQRQKLKINARKTHLKFKILAKIRGWGLFSSEPANEYISYIIRIDGFSNFKRFDFQLVI
jgi:hypothetical protein